MKKTGETINQCKGSRSGRKAFQFQVTTLWTAEVFNPSNWCTIEPHQRPEKKKHHACKHVLIPVLHHDGTVKCISVHEHCTLLGKAEKRCFTASCTTTRLRRKTVSPQHSGQLFKTSTFDRLRSEHWPAVPLY